MPRHPTARSRPPRPSRSRPARRPRSRDGEAAPRGHFAVRRALRGDPHARGARVLAASCTDRFAHTRHELLAIRLQTRVDAANGRDPKFLPETEWIRDDPSWRVAGAGPGLEDRVEITGPTDRKMAINALNSGAKVWLADHEDATSPTWANVVEGLQLSLLDFSGDLEYTSPEGEHRVTATETPTIVFRPRGWHLVEKHLRFHRRAGRAMHASGSLVDFGLYFFHNAKASSRPAAARTLPAEARVAPRGEAVERHLRVPRARIPQGTIRATVLIETIQAAFQMDGEILYELRDHCAGLNAGRWDYIFSIVKTFRSRGRRCHARPQVDHHDGAVHAGLHRAARRRATSAARTRSAR